MTLRDIGDRPAPAPPVPVVLHPAHPPGLDAALVRVSNEMILLAPSHPDEVADLIRHEAVAIVTGAWNPSFAPDALRWVQATTAGIEQFPLPELSRRGIVVTTAAGVHDQSVATHAWALVFTLVRGIGAAMRNMPTRTWAPQQATELAGRTVAVVGLGPIGREIVRMGRSLGLSVIGVTRRPDHHRADADRVFRLEDIGSAFSLSDIAMVALPGGPDTAGLIGDAELRRLGKGWLVNVGRGAVVDDVALVAALEAGSLAGAGLDVTAVEPLPPNHPLWTLPNVVLTPHMAWSSDRLAQRFASLFLMNLEALLGRGHWVNRVV